jgi:phage protein D
MAGDIGRGVKVDESKTDDGKFSLIVFSLDERDKVKPVGTLDLSTGRPVKNPPVSGSFVLSHAFDIDNSARFGRCLIKFLNSRAGKVIEAQFPEVTATAADYAALGLDIDAQTLNLRLPLDNADQAVEICKGRLRRANAAAHTGRLTLVGDPGLVAGVALDITGAGVFDGRYIITRATHSPIGGYTTEVELRAATPGI